MFSAIIIEANKRRDDISSEIAGVCAHEFSDVSSDDSGRLVCNSCGFSVSLEKKKFVKKPIIIEAQQLLRDLTIPTLEGDMNAKAGDYLVTGVKGEQYPVRKDIFEETYRKPTLLHRIFG